MPVQIGVSIPQPEQPTADLIPDYEKLLSDSSYDIIVSTLTLLNASNPSKLSQYLETTKGITGVTGRNVEIKVGCWLL